MVQLKETKHVRAGETVFSKHKYLTQSTITNSDALIKAADDLSQAIQGTIPKKGATMETVEQLLDISSSRQKIKRTLQHNIGC